MNKQIIYINFTDILKHLNQARDGFDDLPHPIGIYQTNEARLISNRVRVIWEKIEEAKMWTKQLQDYFSLINYKDGIYRD